MTRFLVMGCLHGKITKGLERKLKNKKFDAILFLGDLAGQPKLYELLMRKFAKDRDEPEEMVISYEDLLKAEYLTGIRSMKWLNSFKKPVYVIFGNHDKHRIRFLENSEHGYSRKLKNYDLVMKKFKHLKYVHNKNFKINELDCAAYGGYVEIDTYVKSDILGEGKSGKKHRIRAYKIFEREVDRIGKTGIDIFMSHYPPYMIFDKIKNKLSGVMNGKHAGFSGYNRLIRKFKPKVFLHAHMHEYQGIKRLHDTYIIACGAALKNEFAILDMNKSGFDVEFY